MIRDPISPRCLLAGLALLALGACARVQDAKLVDPRTGVAAYCRADRANATVAVHQIDACRAELAFYGFQDEASLLAGAAPQRGSSAALPPAQSPTLPFVSSRLPNTYPY